jgi:mannose-6-phosphate isomerase-like protein (cupin superfamily)
MSSSQALFPWHLLESEGEAIWCLGSLMILKASAQTTAGAFDLMEVRTFAGMAVLPHIHSREDEFFYLLEGRMTFTRGEQTILAQSGSFVFLPRGISHSFRVEVPGTRYLALNTPAGFQGYFQEMGEPAREPVVPSSFQLDVAKMKRLAHKYGVEMLGPVQA